MVKTKQEEEGGGGKVIVEITVSLDLWQFRIIQLYVLFCLFSCSVDCKPEHKAFWALLCGRLS